MSKAESTEHQKSVKKKSWFARHKLLTVIGVLVILAVIGSAASGGDKSGITSTGGTAQNAEQQKTEFVVGETVTFDDKSIAVTEVQRNYSTGNQFSQPEAGKEFVLVTVAITNNGSSSMDYNTFEFKLQDSNGVQQSESFGALSEGKLNSGSLAAGGKVTGKLAYEVPKDDAGLKLLYQSFSFFDNKIITIKL